MKKWIGILLLLLFSVISCDKNTTNPSGPLEKDKSKEKPVFEVEVLKWYDGHRAAVSITYDALWGHWRAQRLIDFTADEVLRRNLRIDFEFVTAKYDHPEYEFIVTDIRENVILRGIHFYGHGHTHAYHDSLSYESAYNSFKKCYDLMDNWGMQPRAYAYPYGAGKTPDVQRADEQAGFICARGITTDPNLFYICPDDKTEPDNWYYLPTIPMGQEDPEYINNHNEMEPLLHTALEKKAWVIIMYHAIGFPDDWGYYPINEFIKDLDQIETHDFWGGNMDMTACYIKERNLFQLEVTTITAKEGLWEYDIIFRDGLDNSVYNQPLTLEFTFESTALVQKMQMEPPVNSQSEFTVNDNKLRLNVIPDEKKYRVKLYKE